MTPKKALLVVLHNSIIHPWLPVADLANHIRPGNRFSRALYRLHDRTGIPGYG